MTNCAPHLGSVSGSATWWQYLFFDNTNRAIQTARVLDAYFMHRQCCTYTHCLAQFRLHPTVLAEKQWSSFLRWFPKSTDLTVPHFYTGSFFGVLQGFVFTTCFSIFRKIFVCVLSAGNFFSPRTELLRHIWIRFNSNKIGLVTIQHVPCCLDQPESPQHVRQRLWKDRT